MHEEEEGGGVGTQRDTESWSEGGGEWVVVMVQHTD